MQYGYFDDQNREYVITRPDTPSAWANYLGSPEYGALISNNAGGYSFVKSGANGRILRYNFDNSDKPGRYIYLRDNKDGDFWSASWQPVGKDLSVYKNECRHGLGYSRFAADYRGIHSEALYYVPLGETYEVWGIRVRNDSDTERSLTLTGYAEFTNHSNYEQDLVNLQYSRYISRTIFRGDRIAQQIHGNLAGLEENEKKSNDDVEERVLALVGAEVSSCCGDKARFLGDYHTYRDPEGVASGNLGNEMCYNEYCCGALSSVITLQPGQEICAAFLLGRKNDEEISGIIPRYKDVAETISREVADLKADWERKISGLSVKTPDPAFDTMINIWNAYNCFMTFTWSRAASFTYCGLRNGYGYRDTVQDIQGVIHLEPEMAKEKIRFMLSAQTACGGGLPLVKFTHTAGKENTPDDPEYVRETGHPAYRADDALWLFPTVYKYVAETGDTAFLSEKILYADHGEDTVYGHLKNAIRFSMEHLGPHGMPAGLHADWNDCLRLGANGESSFVAFQYYYAMTVMKVLADAVQDREYRSFLDAEQEKFGKLLQELCWNEDRFIRGFTEAGEVIGERTAPEASMWLNPQSWAVISNLAKKDQAEAALGKVNELLNTKYGLILMDPPFRAHAFEGALAVIYNAGVKENSGIFLQSQGWIILAEALLGHGDRAYSYYKESCPAAQNDTAEIRKLEPYCYGQFTEGKASPHFGRSHVHWLTGTASTVMVGAVEGILGLRPDLGGLRLSPAVPSSWDHFEMRKEFRGCTLNIVVENPDHAQSGCRSLTVNGEAMADNYIPASVLKEGENEIRLIMG